VTPLRIGALPADLRSYHERLHALLAVPAIAVRSDPANLVPADAPSRAEVRLGEVLGQALHQGCSLADVALAAGLPDAQIVAIGKRTIRHTNWLTHL
jgi:hypothetical protein